MMTRRDALGALSGMVVAGSLQRSHVEAAPVRVLFSTAAVLPTPIGRPRMNYVYRFRLPREEYDKFKRHGDQVIGCVNRHRFFACAPFGEPGTVYFVHATGSFSTDAEDVKVMYRFQADAIGFNRFRAPDGALRELVDADGRPPYGHGDFGLIPWGPYAEITTEMWPEAV